MTGFAPLLAWQRNRTGDWAAGAVHAGLHVRLYVIDAEPGWCPCQPGDCEHPGIPSVVVYATSSAPMTTPAAGARCDLTTVEQGIHVPGGTSEAPGGTVNAVALLLVIAAADTGLAALAELAAYAARLGER